MHRIARHTTGRAPGSPGVKYVHAGKVDRDDDNIQMAELDYEPEENAAEVDRMADYAGGAPELDGQADGDELTI